jgi:F-box and WD-40 domain protein 1/11
MALLDDLPTSVIAQLVEQLNPRLYIDFIRYLPPEVCLKILGYLDPTSLINAARSCRAWYDLALDRKLWEQLYYLEGWQAKHAEIERWEKIVNDDGPFSGFTGHLPRMVTSQEGHVHKKRAISTSPGLDAGGDISMVDVDGTIRQEPAEMEVEESSIFGPSVGTPATSGLSQPLANLQVHGSGSSTTSRRDNGKGKGKASSPAIGEESMPEIVPFGMPKQTLWMWDSPGGRYKINWKYLYTMRRRLEANWELGKYTNFQLPHPDHPEEGHNECIYSLQYNSQYLVSGSRDRTLRIWNLETRRLVRPPLAAHGGSVLCLQFDSDPEEDLIVSGSSDSDVILWRFSTGEVMQRLRDAHRESVLNVKFDKRILVTCSKDKTIKVFNRHPLRYGDMGYPSKEVDPVPRVVKKYGYDFSPRDQLPVIPPYTMIGVLEGHGAAVNAVQIHNREVVSASGDRHIKVWDWPTFVCTRTVVGHNKGIACVQYDGRRIVSGSSDNEVKVFDSQTGLEVASLRSHSDLVRTVQAGFADLPYSADDDEADAKRVDLEYFKAVESGRLDEQDKPRHKRPGNAGSRRPEDITAYGAKLPPGGGGGKYGRIVSGSYDTTIIIWRRDKEGIWKDQHRLKQEDAAAAALRAARSPQPPPSTSAPGVPLHPSMQVPVRPPTVQATASTAGHSATLPMPDAGSGVEPSARTQSSSAPPATGRPSTPTGSLQMTQVESPIHAIVTPRSIEEFQHMIDIAVPGGPQALAQALASYPTMLTQRAHLQAAIDREPSPFVRSQLRQAVNTALIRTQFEQARQRREAVRNFERHLNTGESSTTGGQAQQSHNTTAPAIPVGTMGITGSTAPGPAAAGTHESQERQPDAAQRANPANAQPAVGAGHMFAVHAPVHGAHLHQVPQSSPSPPPAQSQPPAADGAAPALAAQPSTQAPPHARPRHPHIAGTDAANPARVFKLQFDAHRIICCSQTSVIVGWDFCNNDPELVEASRFFAPVQ